MSINGLNKKYNRQLYMQGYLVHEGRTVILGEHTTIGRLANNNIQINENSVSREHAIIKWRRLQSKYYIKDNNTVNGTFVNGRRISEWEPLHHKDALQIGHHAHLLTFYRTNEQSGKIHLKNYCLELEESLQNGSALATKGVIHQKKIIDKEIHFLQKFATNSIQQTVTNQTSNHYFQNPPPVSQVNTNKFKIPDLKQYLQFDDSIQIQQKQNTNVKHHEHKQQQVKVVQKQVKQVADRSKKKVSLPKLQLQLSANESQMIRMHEWENNIYKKQQKQKQKQTQERLALEDQKMRLELEKYNQEQEASYKKTQLQQYLIDQAQKIKIQRQKIQSELIQHKKKYQLKFIQELKKKQQQLKLQKIALLEQEAKKQKQRQKKQIQIEAQKQRITLEQQKYKQNMYKIKQEQRVLKQQRQKQHEKQKLTQEFNRKKRQLEEQAQALARHYQSIYRATVEQMKIQVESQRRTICSLEQERRQLIFQREKQEMEQKQHTTQLEKAKEEHSKWLGRNNAVLLYASHLQQNNEVILNKEINQNIQQSRKLLLGRQEENKRLQEQINAWKGKGGRNIEALLERHSQFQQQKQLYFQVMEHQQALQKVWEEELGQNQKISRKIRDMQQQIKDKRVQMKVSMNEARKRQSQQWVQILRCLQGLKGQKRVAARTLVQQIQVHEQQACEMSEAAEQQHSIIHSAIAQIQGLKVANEYYSSLLFGSNPVLHHFDNMKEQIHILSNDLSTSAVDFRLNLRSLNVIQSIILQTHNASYTLQQARLQLKEEARTLLTEDNIVYFFGDQIRKLDQEQEGYKREMVLLQANYDRLLQLCQIKEARKKALADKIQKLRKEQLQWVKKNVFA